VFLQLTPTITIRRVRTWLCKRMRRYGAPCSGSAGLSLFRSSVDCITNTSGYDFRKAQRCRNLGERDISLSEQGV
jgi:hypothetical protein